MDCYIRGDKEIAGKNHNPYLANKGIGDDARCVVDICKKYCADYICRHIPEAWWPFAKISVPTIYADTNKR